MRPSPEQLLAAMKMKAQWLEERSVASFVSQFVTGEAELAVKACTVIGNHSTAALVGMCEADGGPAKRATYFYFSSCEDSQDLTFISKFENEFAIGQAGYIAGYKAHTEPLNVVPFIRQIWEAHGEPARQMAGCRAFLEHLNR